MRGTDASPRPIPRLCIRAGPSTGFRPGTLPATGPPQTYPQTYGAAPGPDGPFLRRDGAPGIDCEASPHSPEICP